MAGFGGDIRVMPVGDLLLWSANRRFTGQLLLQRKRLETRFVLREGLLYQSSSTDPREHLGQHLINFGWIREEQLAQAFETQQETHVPLGRILVMTGALTDEQLQRTLNYKARESVVEAVQWTEGTFVVRDDAPVARDLDIGVPVDLQEAHSESLARGMMWTEIRNIFPHDDVVVDVLVDPLRVHAGFDRALLQLLQQGHSIGEAALELRALDFQAYSRLYDLFHRRAIAPRSALQPTVVVDQTQFTAETTDQGFQRPNWLIDEPEGRGTTENPDLPSAAQSLPPEIDFRRVPRMRGPIDAGVLAKLSSRERYVLSRVDGQRSLEQIAAVSPIGRRDLGRLVEEFISRGILSL